MEPSLSISVVEPQFPGTKDTVLVLVAEGQCEKVVSGIDASAAKRVLDDGFIGKVKDVRLVQPSPAIDCKRLLISGLGADTALTLESVRRSIGFAIRALADRPVKEVLIDLRGVAERFGAAEVVEAAAETVLLANHRVDDHMKERKPATLSTVLLAVHGKGHDLALAKGIVAGIHTIRARDLINRSPSVATPEYLATYAQESAPEGVAVTVFREQELREHQMGGILAVGKGSAHSPRLIVLEYRPESATRTVALVGKGITFDSGGLSLKPSEGMETMKCDKSGAVAVLETVFAAARMDIPVNIVGICACAENMPGDNAYKLGDVISTAAGISVEILNTDAEGRIVLADALHHATSFDPDVIIDLATLTGACVIALGSGLAGAMGNNQELLHALQSAGAVAGEKVWQLPLEEDYAQLMKSKFADLKNVVGNGKGGGAGAITAGFFLKEFVGSVPWVHLDIAGPAWNVDDQIKGYLSYGGTGFGVRLLLRYLRTLT